ncbi:MAG: hypothetical protein A2340_13470 [Lentisphaerae bacterium RIFOXYB12_FULL_60_10]|nr:MAG: hypothetical protein A2269_07580 [Lentisphaerae bacterium RIFOXYA12_FULL_60_10]OGV84164.1 MAG: hypothetical protein A2340_13470 [Lentisphaerae bacterium RIFOXYB12_FULL_60_10]
MNKADHVMQAVDLERPELAAVRGSATPAEAFAQYVSGRPAGRFRVEYRRKVEILAFCKAHYDAWRSFDPAAADRVAAMTIEQARVPRALSGVRKLGQAWWATGDPKYGTAFEQFYRDNETGSMFTWGAFNGSQGLYELDAWFLLLDCPGFTVEGRVAVLDHLAAIADYAWDDAVSQWNQLALGPEGHNWYLHGMQILPFIALLFPEFKRSEFFLKTGFSVVEEHLRAHYRADGGARETTPSYQQGSVNWLWDFYALARRNAIPLSEGFETRLMNATMHLLRLATPQGSVPSIGDSHHESGGLTNLAAIAAALSGDRECKWYAEQWRGMRDGVCGERLGELPESVFWMVGLEGARTYAAARERNPAARSVLMGSTGYAALRSSGARSAAYLSLAAAERGPIVTSHGHNDVLSMEVHADGVRFVGEMGCAPYGNSPGRNYDERAEAHSCLVLQGEQPVPIVSEWRWKHHLRPAVTRWISEPSHDFIQAVHEGYYQYPERQTLHARKILFRKPRRADEAGYWLVFDWIESTVDNACEVYFHGCVPGQLDGTRIELGEGDATRLWIMPPEGDAVPLQAVESEGRAAYMQERKLDPARHPAYVYRQTVGSGCLVWLLAPMRFGMPPVTLRRLPVQLNGRDADAHAATAVEVAWGGRVETVCLSHQVFDAELAYGDYRDWGLLACHAKGPDGARELDVVHTVSDGDCGR